MSPTFILAQNIDFRNISIPNIYVPVDLQKTDRQFFIENKSQLTKTN